MTFDDYRDWHAGRWARSTAAAQSGDIRQIAIPALGYGGEAGEVQEHFKKHLRDGKPLVGNFALKLELGDQFNYWLQLVTLAGLEVEEVLAGNVLKLTERDAGRKFG